MELDKTEFHELMIPYITNVTAEAVTDVRKSPGLLVAQLHRPFAGNRAWRK